MQKHQISRTVKHLANIKVAGMQVVAGNKEEIGSKDSFALADLSK